MELTLKNCRFEIDENGVATLTIDREDVRNALDLDTWNDLDRFIEYADTEPSIRAVVITGAGQKSFAAGADIRMMKVKKPLDVMNGRAQRILDKFEKCSKAIVAAVNGFAFGGGFELALACDIRIVAQNAKFGLPEAGLGLLPGVGGTQRLTRVVGIGRAKEIILAGRVISGEEAVSMGVAYRCVPYDELLAEAKKCATEIARKGPVAVRLAKQAIRAAMSADQESGMLIELLSLSVLCGTEDKDEGVQAFLEKRAPNFTGK